MSAVKVFALGVLITGTLASSTLAGSIRSRSSSPSHSQAKITVAPTSFVFAPAPPPTIAAENLAGNSNGSGSSNGGNVTMGNITGGGSTSGGPLFLGTSQSSGQSSSSSSINLAGASFQNANSVPGATAPQGQSSMPLSQFTSNSGQPAHSSGSADAFINFGNGPYAEASSLTTGNPQSFVNSPTFTGLFGSKGPSSQDVNNFESKVVSTIQQTYNQAGLPIHLTTDPNAAAAHTLSIVANASNPQTSGAIGITDVGNNGFSFLDKFSGASDPNQLATAVGHNVAHELMHAFGLANHPETDGPYVDAASTTFSNLADPNTTFSESAASLLSTLNFQATGQSVTSGTGSQIIDGNQVLVSDAPPVPEPSTIALWTLGGLAGIAYRRRRSA